jgi:hypothetical protein
VKTIALLVKRSGFIGLAGVEFAMGKVLGIPFRKHFVEFGRKWLPSSEKSVQSMFATLTMKVKAFG